MKERDIKEGPPKQDEEISVPVAVLGFIIVISIFSIVIWALFVGIHYILVSYDELVRMTMGKILPK